MESTVELILTTVKKIPFGRVASYGQIAYKAGLGRGRAREVGYAMFNVPTESEIPWHRVINAKGEISNRSVTIDGEVRQRRRLEQEGVKFSPKGRVLPGFFAWGEESEIYDNAPQTDLWAD